MKKILLLILPIIFITSCGKQEIITLEDKYYNNNTFITSTATEIDSYLENLQEILDFAQTVSSAPINDLDETIGATENVNVFRKDEVEVFENHDLMMQNAPEKESEMFKIPKVL